MAKIKFKAIIEFPLTVDAEWYNTNDIIKIAEIERRNIKNEPEFIFGLIDNWDKDFIVKVIPI